MNASPLLFALAALTLAITAAPAQQRSYSGSITRNYTSGSINFIPYSFGIESETVILHDTFADGDRTNQALPGSAAWYSSSTSGHVSVTEGTLTQNVATGGRHLLAYFADTPVQVEVGQAMEVSVRFSFVNPLDRGAGFRVGMFNSAGMARVSGDNHGGTSASNSAAFELYSGYRAEMNPLPAPGAAQLGLRKRDPVAGDIQGLLLANNSYPDASRYLLAVDDYAFQADVIYDLRLMVARTGDDLVRVTYEVTGPDISGLFASYQNSPNVVTSFDSLALGTISTTMTSFTLHEVKVRTFEQGVPPIESPSLAVAMDGTDLVLVSPTQSGLFYRIQRSLSLSPAEWTDVGGEAAGDGSPIEWRIDTTALPESPQVFFRVGVAP